MMLIDLLTSSTPFWGTLAVGFLGPSALKASIDLYRHFNQRSPREVSSPDNSRPAAESRMAENKTLVVLKESSFLKSNTMENKIYQFAKATTTLTLDDFLEAPDYWLKRYAEKCREIFAVGILLIFGATLLAFVLFTVENSEVFDYFAGSLAIGAMLGGLPILMNRYNVFSRDLGILEEYASWRKEYGLTVELAFVQTREGAEKMSKAIDNKCL